MEIKELNQKSNIQQHKKLMSAYTQINNLLLALETQGLPDEIVIFINTKIDHINAISNSEKEIKKELRKSQSSMLLKIEKELKLVPKNYYRNTWLAIGMAAFGIPLGVVFGAALGNMGFLGIGLPIGMVIGLAVGTQMDKKAFEEGRQLDLEIT
ncbi:hypothetical protein LPB03_03105 [Polaribacter vadi]|uniref:Glycine zipper family protein n=1 Tax=Polaribacter vadi TaxID=1774273 RepID=A0A1B8TYK7_9FLAO|nr:hypothetical protein [Polaribacter vadi]AOW16515.1 hypothetical protein LPB03_03105 [Polaribacter vadi]OBY64579.1 hypothetical protein LPB3_09390 [Polaribacter vadi]